MIIANSVMEMFSRLNTADDWLEAALRAHLNSFFCFLKNSPRNIIWGSHWLRMRAERNRAGRIWKLSWTIRIKHKRLKGGKAQSLTRRLEEPFHRGWVYTIAHDWARRDHYYEVERKRSLLNNLHGQVAKTHRRLRLSFLYRWASRANDQDRQQAEQLVSRPGVTLPARDFTLVLAILAFCRELQHTEGELGQLVQVYRDTFMDRMIVEFEPALRPTPGGTLQLYWGFPSTVHTPGERPSHRRRSPGSTARRGTAAGSRAIKRRPPRGRTRQPPRVAPRSRPRRSRPWSRSRRSSRGP